MLPHPSNIFSNEYLQLKFFLTVITYKKYLYVKKIITKMKPTLSILIFLISQQTADVILK